MIELILLGLVALVVAVFTIFFISVCFLEKQHLSEYVPLPQGKRIEETPYFRAMNDAAQRLGFILAGIFIQDRQSRMYQAQMAIWISPDHQSLLRIGGGKTAGIENKRSWLTTFVEPAHIIETTDESTLADLSGLTDRKWLLNACLEELVACHFSRVAKNPGNKRTFPLDQAYVACVAMQTRRVMRLESMGLARFINREKTIWRFTFKGACRTYFKGFREQLAEGQAQEYRLKLRRPGAK